MPYWFLDDGETTNGGQTMSNETIVLDQPDQIAFARLAALKGALKLECLGMGRSRGPSAYSILKREYGFKGNKQAVLEQAQAAVSKALGD